MANTLITATTSAASGIFTVGEADDEPVTVHGWGFSGTDEAVIQMSYDGGTTFQDLYEGGAKAKLDSNNTSIGLYSVGIYKINKGATTGTVGVSLSRRGDL